MADVSVFEALQDVLDMAAELGQPGSEDLNGLLDRVLEKMIQVSQADGGCIVMLDEAGNLTVKSRQGVDPRPGKKLLAEVLRERAPVVHETALGLPLTVGRKGLGAVVLRHSPPWPEAQIGLLSSMAGLAALVVRNRQLYAWSEMQAISEERGRIATDIHDGVVQSLLALMLKVDLCSALLDRNPQEVKAELEEMRAILKKASQEVRRAIFALRPVELESLDFPSALRRYAQEFGDKNQLAVHLTVKGHEAKLTPKSETALLRVIQEALNNVGKHAQAQNVWIDLDLQKPDQVQISVKDDGRGFVLDEVLAAPSYGWMGIKGMRDRVERGGGTFTIKTAPEQGTEITATLPLR